MRVSPREDRRLKALGLVCFSFAVAGIVWLSKHPPLVWPIPTSDLQRYLGVAAGIANLIGFGWLLVAAGLGRARSLSDPHERRAIGLYLLTANVLVPAVVYGFVTSDPAMEQRVSQTGWDVPLSLMALVLGVAAFRALRRAWRHETSNADEAMARDRRPPVLYLRSFRDDENVALTDWGFKLSSIYGLIVWATPEQEMATVLDRVGPVIAIGKPDEDLPELGAARLYVSHAEWQQKVTTLMSHAGLVVVRVGASPGVLWEIERALETIPRERLLLVLLGDGPLAPPIAARLAPVLGPALADAAPAPRPGILRGFLVPDPKRRLGGVVCFPGGGPARVAPVRGWPIGWRDFAVSLALRPSAGALRHTFRQVFNDLGLSWEGSPRPPSRGVALGLAVGLGLFGAHWFYLGNRRRGRAYLYCALFGVPWMLALIDAVRMVWMEQAEFDRRHATPA